MEDQYSYPSEDMLKFWQAESDNLYWFQRPTKTVKFNKESKCHEWFGDGMTNASYNALDFPIEKGLGKKIAFYYEGEEGEQEKITYEDLLRKVSNYCHFLVGLGAIKGQHALIYMSTRIDAITVMLACSRLGLVHSVVFGGFSAQALAGRIDDFSPDFIFTHNKVRRNGKDILLYKILQDALKLSEAKKVERIKEVFVGGVNSLEKMDCKHQILEHCEKKFAKTEIFPALALSAKHPHFVLYTSGSTGSPKGILHTLGGYLVYVAYTMETVFPEKYCPETFWCSADIGWITGHSYVVYGPLLCGRTSLIYDGGPISPHPERIWELIDKYRVSVFYTAPTLIRSLMAIRSKISVIYSLKSLKLLGSVGEPINSSAWNWFYEEVGKKNCYIVDTWWQTETGGIIATPLLGRDLRPVPGKAMDVLPFQNYELYDEEGKVICGAGKGLFTLRPLWPGMAATIQNNHVRFLETYFAKIPGRYFTGDLAERNELGELKIIGRADDVMNISGHRLGTAELEAALTKHEKIVEAAVISIPHPLKGECPIGLVVPSCDGIKDKMIVKLVSELDSLICKEIGKFAKPEKIYIVEELPKTRSGKIMRRVLKKILLHDEKNLGDLSTLSSPHIIENISGQIRQDY